MLLLPGCGPGTAAMPPPPPATETLASRDLDVPLDPERATVAVDLPAALPETKGKRLGLYLDVAAPGRTGTYFEVYADLPPGTEPRPAGPHYLGTLSSFGPRGGAATTVGYDVTKLLRTLAAEGRWNGRMTLTFVRRGLLPPAGKPGVAPKPAPRSPRLVRVRLVRE